MGSGGHLSVRHARRHQGLQSADALLQLLGGACLACLVHCRAGMGGKRALFMRLCYRNVLVARGRVSASLMYIGCAVTTGPAWTSPLLKKRGVVRGADAALLLLVLLPLLLLVLLLLLLLLGAGVGVGVAARAKPSSTGMRSSLKRPTGSCMRGRGCCCCWAEDADGCCWSVHGTPPPALRVWAGGAAAARSRASAQAPSLVLVPPSPGTAGPGVPPSLPASLQLPPPSLMVPCCGPGAWLCSWRRSLCTC